MSRKVSISVIFMVFCSINLATADEWNRKADMLTPRDTFGTAVANGKIYAIGGWVLPNTSISMFEEYDPINDKWISRKNMPTSRCQISVEIVNKKLYVIGGWSSQQNAVLSTVEEYDPAKDEWTVK